MVEVKCGITTCVSNKDGKCEKESLELNYFDDYSVLGDATLPDGTKLISYVSNTVGHFMGLHCKDFRMDYNRVKESRRNK